MSNQQQQQKENVLDEQQEQQIVHSLSRYLKSSSSSTVDPGQSNINTTTANANNNNCAFTVSRYAIPRLGTPIADQQQQQNHLVSSRPSSAMSDYETGADTNIDEEITAEYLKSITGFDELHFVSDVELKVNNKTQSVHLLSSFLPNVVHLRMSRSNISSIRELGTTFTSLRVLWLAASRLNSLNGIQHIGSHLRELFLAFNNIKDVTPLCLGGLKHLEVLDLEGNMIEDGESAIKDLISLENLPSLKSLNLAGNPFISSAEDHDENENEDEDDEDDYSHHTHQYHKMVLRRIREVSEEQNEEEEKQDLDDDDENHQSKNNTDKKKKKVPLEYLDDTPIEEIQVKVMVADSNKNNKNTEDDAVFDGQHDDDESKNNNSSEIDEEFASARRRLQSRRENENKRNDPLFRTMFDELSLLQNAIRSQLGQTGENLVAEETVRTTSQLMSRQRSLAPDEQRQRVRVATARGQQQQQPHCQSTSSRPTSGEETKHHQPAPPPQSKKMMPTPPTSSSRMNSASPTSSSSTTTPVSPTSENNNGNGEDSAAAAVGSLVHRLRSNKKLQQEKTGVSPEKEKEQEEALSMAEILSKKISTSANEKNRQQVSQRDPRFAARKRQQMEETDRLLDEIDAKYAALENENENDEENDYENSSSDQHRKKPLFQSWLPHSKSHQYQDPNDDKSTSNKISGRRTGTSTTNSSTRSSSQNSSVTTTKSDDDDEDYLRPVSRSHKDRMHQARKLLDLANKKKEHAEKKLIRRQERKRGERVNDDDDGEMSSDVSSVSSFTSSTYSTTTTYSSSLSSSRSSSSLSSRSSASSPSKSNNDDDKKLSSSARRHHHHDHSKVQAAPISDSEILQEVLVDKEIALAKLKKDIAGRDGFLTAVGDDSSRGKNFEAVEWQGGDAEKVQNTL